MEETCASKMLIWFKGGSSWLFPLHTTCHDRRAGIREMLLERSAPGLFFAWAWSILDGLQLFRFSGGKLLEVFGGDDGLVGLGLNILSCPASYRPAVLSILFKRNHTLG